MKKENKSATANLRKKAVEVLNARRDVACNVSAGVAGTGVAGTGVAGIDAGKGVACNISATNPEMLNLIQELEIHQIELELQNEELVRAKSAAQDTAKKYTELFDFAPSGYFTLLKDGKIIDLNHSGSQMVGKDRLHLKNSKFGFFVSGDTKSTFNHFLEQAFSSKTNETCEVILSPNGKLPMNVHLTGIVTENGEQCLVNVVDITERKQKEESLLISEENFRILSDQSPIAVERYNEMGFLVTVNPACLSLFGVTDIKEIKNFNLFADPNISDEHKKKLKRNEMVHYQALFDFEKVKALNLYNTSKSGSLWLDAIITPLKDNYGKVNGYLAHITDFTERKHTEDELRESQELLTSIIETAKDSIFIKDTSLQYTKVNKAMASLFEMAKEDIIGKSDSDIFGAESGVHIEEIDRQVLSGHTVEEYPSKPVNGEMKHFHTIKVPMKDADGQINGLCGIARDITERRLVEDQQRRSEEKYRNIFESLQDVYYEASVDGTLLEITPSIEIISKGQFTRNELIGKSFVEFYTDPDARNSFFSELIQQGTVTDYELSFRNKDGSIVPLAVSSRLLYDADRNPEKITGSFRDITERKRTEKILHARRQELILMNNQLLMAQQIGHTGSWLYDLATQKLWGSAEARRLFGIDENEEYFTLAIIEACIPDRDRVHQALLDLINKGIPYDLEYVIHPADGSMPRVIISKATLEKDDAGNVTSIVGVIQDITDRKQAEEELKKLSQAVEQSPVMTCITDLTGRIEYVNPKALELTGYTKEELIGKNPRIFNSGEKPKEEYKILWQTISSGNEWKGEFHNKKKNGELYWTLASISPVVDPGGKITHYLAIQEDITQRKITEKNLRDSEDRYRSIFQGSADGIMIADAETKMIMFANSAQCQLLGYTEAQLTTMNISEIHPKDTYQDTLAEFGKQARGEKTLAENIQCLKKNGEIFYAEINSQTFEINGRKHAAGFFRDITERKQSEKVIHDLLANLSLKVDERTAQLNETNKNLLKEIEERKQAEDALKQLSTRLTLAARAGGVGVWDFDIVNDILMWDDQMFALYGIQKKDFGGAYQAWQAGLHPDDRVQGDVEIQAAIRGEKEFDTEFRVVWPDGTIHNIRAMAVVQRDSSKKPFHLIGTNWDITEQKQAETLLDQTRLNYETFFNTIDDFLFVLDEQGNIIHTNNTVLMRLGYSTDELQERSVLMVHPVERREEAGRIVGEMLVGKADFCPVPLITKSGNLIPVETRVRHGFWDGKSVIFGVSKDVSKIKLSEEKFSKAFHTNAALMAISGFKDARYIDVNETFIKTLGYSREELIGKTAGEYNLFDAPELRNAITEKLSQKIPVREVELVARTKSGGHIIGLFSADLIYIGNDLCLLTMLVDITERKRAEEELREARNEADKANRAKSDFISHMSHEFRTPMNSILGYAQLMDMSELIPAHRIGVNNILNSGNQLLNLINLVLDLSAIEAGKLSISPEPVQLSGIIGELIDAAQPLVNARQLKFELINSPATELFVLADRLRLQQVLLNLISNAIKYNQEGGSVIIKTEVRQPEVPGCSLVRISITDTGLGISPDDIPKLFVPFERFGAKKNKTEGTGLGLSITKELIYAMEGDIGVESILGEGSTFWIELPVIGNQKTLKEHALHGGDAFKTGTTNTEKTRTILYIEDNVPSAELVEGIIGSHRPAIRVITTPFGKLAVQFATDLVPELILLDLDLPDIHGIEVFANLLANDKTKSIPVIILSADALTDKIENLMKAGAVDYLTKPLDVATFLKVVDSWMGAGSRE